MDEVKKQYKMKLNQETYVIKKMITLINLEKTGTPEELSNQLGISRSQLYAQISELNSLGATIQYDRKLNSFVLKGSKKIVVQTPIVVVDDNDLAKISGGYSKKKCSVLFSGRSEAILAV